MKKATSAQYLIEILPDDCIAPEHVLHTGLKELSLTKEVVKIRFRDVRKRAELRKRVRKEKPENPLEVIASAEVEKGSYCINTNTGTLTSEDELESQGPRDMDICIFTLHPSDTDKEKKWYVSQVRNLELVICEQGGNARVKERIDGYCCGLCMQTKNQGFTNDN